MENTGKMLQVDELFPVGVPENAEVMGPFLGFPDLSNNGKDVSPEVMKQTAIAQQRQFVDQHNTYSDSINSWLFSNWKWVAERARAQGLAAPPKPDALTKLTLHVYEQPDTTMVWTWKDVETPVCPDLDPLPPHPPVGNIAIGKRLSKIIWQALPSDTVTIGEQMFLTTPDGVSGTFERLGSPFGGHWILVKAGA